MIYIVIFFGITTVYHIILLPDSVTGLPRFLPCNSTTLLCADFRKSSSSSKAFVGLGRAVSGRAENGSVLQVQLDPHRFACLPL